MELKPFEEFIGTLERVLESDSMTILYFKVISPVEVPSDHIDHGLLEECVGERIGILNTPEGVRIRRL